jgi:hypothetical protein
VRYRFRGLIRETGKPAEGHVESDTEELAYQALGEHGILTEALWPDPKPLNLSPVPERAQEFSNALDSALDTSSTQVPFDDLTERYKGKRVWVIDRDKIRKNVAQVVDQAIEASLGRADSVAQTREAVAEAIAGLFKDTTNLTSPANQVAKNAPAAAGGPVNASPALEEQIHRLAHVVAQAQNALASIVSAAGRVGSGGGGYGGGPRRYNVQSSVAGQSQKSVLLEIFKENLELHRSLDPSYQPLPESAEGAGAPAASGGEAAAGESEVGDAGAGEAGAGEAEAASASGDVETSPPEASSSDES